MDISESIVVFDIKVGRCGQLNVYMNLYTNISGQDHSSSKITLFQHFQTSFP